MNLDLEFPEASNPWRKVCVLVNGKEVIKPRVQKITRYFLLGKDDLLGKDQCFLGSRFFRST